MFSFIKKVVEKVMELRESCRKVVNVKSFFKANAKSGVIAIETKYSRFFRIKKSINKTNVVKYVGLHSDSIYTKYQTMYNIVKGMSSRINRKKLPVYKYMYFGISNDGIPKLFGSDEYTLDTNITKYYRRLFRLNMKKAEYPLLLKFIEQMYNFLMDTYENTVLNHLMDDLECELFSESIKITSESCKMNIHIRMLTNAVRYFNNRYIGKRTIDDNDLFVIYKMSDIWYDIVGIGDFDFDEYDEYVIVTGKELLENVMPPTILFEVRGA